MKFFRCLLELVFRKEDDNVLPGHIYNVRYNSEEEDLEVVDENGFVTVGLFPAPINCEISSFDWDKITSWELSHYCTGLRREPFRP